MASVMPDFFLEIECLPQSLPLLQSLNLLYFTKFSNIGRNAKMLCVDCRNKSKKQNNISNDFQMLGLSCYCGFNCLSLWPIL